MVKYAIKTMIYKSLGPPTHPPICPKKIVFLYLVAIWNIKYTLTQIQKKSKHSNLHLLVKFGHMWLATASTSVSLSRAGNQVGEGNMWGNGSFKGYFLTITQGVSMLLRCHWPAIMLNIWGLFGAGRELIHRADFFFNRWMWTSKHMTEAGAW